MKLTIVQYGDPVLRAKGKRVDPIDHAIQKLAEDMIETMREANGVGLAAQQVGQALQLTVIDVSEVEDRPSTLKIDGQPIDVRSAMPMILINPEIRTGGDSESGTEGCLSFPEITGEIERARGVTVKAQNEKGEVIEFEAGGLLARAIQHEIDHLNGVLFIDRMSSAAKTALSSRLKRLQKETQRGIKHRAKATTEATL